MSQSISSPTSPTSHSPVYSAEELATLPRGSQLHLQSQQIVHGQRGNVERLENQLEQEGNRGKVLDGAQRDTATLSKRISNVSVQVEHELNDFYEDRVLAASAMADFNPEAPHPQRRHSVVSAEELATLPRGAQLHLDTDTITQSERIQELENLLQDAKSLPKTVGEMYDGAKIPGKSPLPTTLPRVGDVRRESQIMQDFEDRVLSAESLANFGVVQDQGGTGKPQESRIVVLKQNQWIMHAVLAIGSFAGVPIRVYVGQWMTYVGAPVYSLMYANFIGCVIMGYVAAARELLFESYYPIFLGLGTGLCGSITTFSSWSLLIVRSLANFGLKIEGGPAYYINAALAYVIVGLCTGIGGLYMGRHIAKIRWLDPKRALARRNVVTKHTSYQFVPTGWTLQGWTWPDWTTIVLLVLCLLAFLIPLILIPSSRPITFAMLFGPLGTWLRWRLSVLNVKNPSFPVGTFTANVLGTIVLCGMYLAQSVILVSSPNDIACSIIYGISNGFCGCLTTISTFILEISTMGTKDCYVYGATSIVVADVLGFITCGIYLLVVGAPSSGVCVTV